MENNEIEVKPCCHICDNLWKREKCPLFCTYDCAQNYGDDTFDEMAKYKVCCTDFVVNEKLTWWRNEK